MARKKEAPDVSKLVEVFAQTFAQAMLQAQKPAAAEDEWAVVEEPLKREITEEESKELEKFVAKPSPDLSAKKPLVPFKTHTFLDDLFLAEDDVTPLGGIPVCSQLAITGLPGAGKSLLAMEIALRVANDGRKVLYVTSEDVFTSDTPRFDLQSRLMKKSQILGLDWAKVVENLFVMDAATYSELREWSTFIRTYRYTCEKENVELAIVDSITLLETQRGALKYRVSEITRYNQKRGITGIFINQRSTEDVDVFAMAGGISLAHTYDIVVIIDYCRAYSAGLLAELKRYGIKRGDFVRFGRVLDCGLCGYRREYVLLDIDKHGFLRPVYPVEAEAQLEP